MKRRTFIAKAMLAAMALPFAVKKSRAVVPELIIALIILSVGAFIISKLAGLCKNKLGNPKQPPKDPDSTSTAPTASTFVEPAVPFDDKLDVSFFGLITDTSAAFKSPSGSLYWCMMGVNMDTSTDLQAWESCGQILMWISDDYLKIQQTDENGVVTISTIQNWKTQARIPTFNTNYPYSQARFFRTTPAL